MIIKKCKFCGKEYEAKTVRSVFCCGKCKSKYGYYKLSTKNTCEWCGKEFISLGYSGDKRRFCSVSCGSKHTHSKLGARESKCNDCGKTVFSYGVIIRKRCDECKRIHNNILGIESSFNKGKTKNPFVGKGYGVPKGKEHHSYITGIGSFRQVKREHLIQQGKEIACEECGTTEGRLEVHHIDHNRKNNDILNLILLCKKCHKQKHIKRDELGRFI